MSKFACFALGLILASTFAFTQQISRPSVAGNDGVGGLEQTYSDSTDAPFLAPILIGFCGSSPSVKTCTLICLTTNTGTMDSTFTESDGTVYTYAGMASYAPFAGHVIGRVTVWQCWYTGTEWVGVRTA